MHTLDTVPSEILQHIVIRSLDDTTGPPSIVSSLLRTSKSMSNALNFRSNPSFYADLFDCTFDTDALKRRFSADRLTAVNRADELIRRWTLLKEIRDIVALTATATNGKDPEEARRIWGDPTNGIEGTYTYDQKLQHAWLAYMLITESDGWNWEQLEWAGITLLVYRFMCYDIDRISEAAQTTGLLPESNELRSIMLWLWWLTLKYDDIIHERPVALSKVNRMLRPFAFASFGYSFFFGPWTSRQLPDPGEHTIFNGTADGPLFSDPRPYDRTVTLPRYFGSPLDLSPPHLSQAAALLFFSRMQRYPLGQMEVLPSDVNALSSFRAHHDEFDPYTPVHATINFPAVADSERYDEDVMRMIWCRDPTKGTLPGLRPRWSYQPGSFVGEWEGRFVNYGILGYQAIGEGAPPLHALESEPLRQDPQAWRIREFHHPSSLRGHLKRQYHRFLRRTYTPASHLNSSASSEIWAPFSHKRPPIKDVGATKALFNGFVPPSTKRVPAHGGVEVSEPGQAGQPVFYAEVKRSPSGRTYIGEYDPADEEVVEVVEEDEDEDDGPAEDSASDEIDVLVEGVAIPRVHVFPYESVSMMEVDSLIYGTIRRWDGLIHLHALAVNGPTWLYRGYLTSNGNWIGRSRDTWTSDFWREGYEGVFVMTRRE